MANNAMEKSKKEKMQQLRYVKIKMITDCYTREEREKDMKRIFLVILLAVLLLTSCGLPAETEAPVETGIVDTSDAVETATDTESDADTETEQPIGCQHTETEDRGEKAGVFMEGYSKIVCMTCGETVSEGATSATQTVRILAIGNSFSEDATTYMYDMLKAAGVKYVIVANAFIAGCTLDKHYDKSQSGEAAYKYTKYSVSGKSTRDAMALEDIVTDETWDVITLQQASGYSGMPADYSHLGDMVEYVKTKAKNPDVDVKFHMTWAYHATSKNGHFEKYSDDQATMYQAIVNTVKSEVLTNPEITGVIPVGTAIQNLRTSYIGDTLHRDESSHLTHDIGRYTAGLTWVCYLTGISPYDIEWYPASFGGIKTDIEVIRHAIQGALESPYEVTRSNVPVKHSETATVQFAAAGLDINDYEVIDWEAKPQYCWNSTKNAKTTKTSGYLYYTASRMFTREELPVGSVIIVESGYQYRPEGWVALDQVNASSARPKNTSEAMVIVSEEWWGDFNYRAFNLSSISDRSNATAESAKNFTIYVPKE